ncbi:tetratricopeptide repeat protein [Phormidium tenue FACHB-886]|nr:tetratricopeptide repeat protein [Phormidium tenue FACHB-886]
MLNPFQRYFPKLHRLLSTTVEPDAQFEVQFDGHLDASLDPPFIRSAVDAVSSAAVGGAAVGGAIAPEPSRPSARAVTPTLSPAEAVTSIPLPLNLTELLQRAHSLLVEGHQTEAIAHYRHALQLDPNCGTAYQYLAEALSQQGDLEAAAVCYRRAIELSMIEAVAPSAEPQTDEEPEALADEATAVDVDEADEDEAEAAEEEMPWFEEASFYLQQAEALCHQRDWAEAVMLCQQATQLMEPQLATAYLIAAKASQQQGNLEAAAQFYSKAIIVQPTAEAYARLGNLYAQQQRLADAVQHYQQAIALDPQFAGAYWKLAEVLQQQGDTEAALTCRYQALQRHPQWASAVDNLKWGDRLRLQGKLEWAIDCYRWALQLDSELAEAYHGLGAALGQQGNWQAAIEQHQQAVLRRPQTTQFHLSLGDALLALKQWEQAVDCFRQATSLEPETLQGYLGLREALVKLDRWTEALACYQTLTELQPQSGKAFHELGDALSRMNQWVAAAKAFEQAIALQPHFSWSYNNLGYALLQLERWQPAAAAFRQAIALHPEFHWSYYNLGEALVKLEEWDEAIAAYEQALQLQPDMPHVKQKLGDALQQRAQTDLEIAFRHYQEAIEQDPEDEQNYHKALSLKPNDVWLYQQLADTLTRHNKQHSAILFYQIVEQLRAKEAKITAPVPVEAEPAPLQLLGLGFARLYDYWLRQHTPTSDSLRHMVEAAARLQYQPTISLVMPVYNTPPKFLIEAIESVIEQVYPYWELCIADDASPDPEIRVILEKYAAKDSRIKVVFREKNGHISAASNSALEVATGEYIALLDHDDAITPDALYEVVKLLNEHPEADMIYSDEDKLDDQGQRTDPFFKPDWCPDSFLSRMYTCHLGTYRRSLVEKIQGFRLGYEGAQDYDFVLRFTEQTDRIFHIPKILYHWRIHPASAASGSSAKPYAYTAGKRAINDAIYRRGEPGRVEDHPQFLGFYNVRYQIQQYSRVSIIIPTRNLGKVLNRCLESIFLRSTYPDYEVIVIDNGSDEPETLKVLETWQNRQPERFKCYRLDIPFNYSRINNAAVQYATGDYLLFLNNDTEVIAADWIEGMVEQAQRSSIGAVGARLLYEDEKIQHAGVVLGLGGAAGHVFYHFPGSNPGYFGQLITVNNYSAVTAACLMCRREVFEQVNGFDEDLAVAYNDVDLCLKIVQSGYRNVYLPHVSLYHHESKSRGHEDTPEKKNRLRQEAEILQQRWASFIEHDPCYSPNLTRERADCSLSISFDLEVKSGELEIEQRELLGFAIDSPQVDCQLFSKWVVVSGWVVGQESRAIAVEVMADQLPPQSIPVNLSRPDVARVHPKAPDAKTSGFSAVFDLSNLPLPADLSLQAVLEGGERVKLGTVQLHKKQ